MARWGCKRLPGTDRPVGAVYHALLRVLRLVRLSLYVTRVVRGPAGKLLGARGALHDSRAKLAQRLTTLQSELTEANSLMVSFQQQLEASDINAFCSEKYLSITVDNSSQPRPVRQMLMTDMWSSGNPFKFARASDIDSGYPHTNFDLPPVISFLLDVVKPMFWLEVGTMLGGSAILTAEAVKQRPQLLTSVICIDPFCGDVNMWDWAHESEARGTWQFLRLAEGRLTIYDRFLANVVASHVDDVILPVVATSLVGMRLLKRLHGTVPQRLTELPEIIFLDSAHEIGETMLELETGWDLLAPGGVLFGDDWAWVAVRHDVTVFAARPGLKFSQERINALLSANPGVFSDPGNPNLLRFGNVWILCKG